MKNFFLLAVLLFSFDVSAIILSDEEVVKECQNYANPLYHAFLSVGSEEYKAYTDVELMVEYKYISTSQKNRDSCLQQLKQFSTR